jgi:hypothetical protein
MSDHALVLISGEILFQGVCQSAFNHYLYLAFKGYVPDEFDAAGLVFFARSAPCFQWEVFCPVVSCVRAWMHSVWFFFSMGEMKEEQLFTAGPM